MLHLFPLGDVPHSRNHAFSRRQTQRVEHDVHGKRRAVLAPGQQLQPNGRGRGACAAFSGCLGELSGHQLRNRFAKEFATVVAEHFFRLPIDPLDPAGGVHCHHRVRCGFKKSRERFAEFLPFFLGFLDLIDVDEKNHRSLHLAVVRQIRPDAQRIMVAVRPHDFFFNPLPPPHDPRGQLRQLRHLCTKNPDSFADLAVFQLERLRSPGAKPSHAQVFIEHDYGQIDATGKVVQVVDKPRQFAVPHSQLIVQRCQLLVGALQLFLGSFEFFVRALQLFVGRLHFLVDDLHFLVRRLLVFQHCLKRFTHADELLAQGRHALFGSLGLRILP